MRARKSGSCQEVADDCDRTETEVCAPIASLLILAGNPLVTVQKLMRHSTPELAANLHAQLGLEDLAEAVETLPII